MHVVSRTDQSNHNFTYGFMGEGSDYPAVPTAFQEIFGKKAEYMEAVERPNGNFGAWDTPYLKLHNSGPDCSREFSRPAY